MFADLELPCAQVQDGACSSHPGMSVNICALHCRLLTSCNCSSAVQRPDYMLLHPAPAHQACELRTLVMQLQLGRTLWRLKTDVQLS